MDKQQHNMGNVRFSAIVLAAGQGSRMGAQVAKQYILYRDKPLLYYPLKGFQDSFVDEIILVCPSGDEAFCQKNIVEQYGFTKVKHIVAGGSQRFDSVYQGLLVCQCDYVLIHDGARVCVTQDILLRCGQDVIANKASVAAVPVKDTIKIADAEGYVTDTPARDTLWQVQTPQCFEYALIKSAYDSMFSSKYVQNITDDAMVLENYGHTRVHLVQGSYSNIKVTTPEDLAMLDGLL